MAFTLLKYWWKEDTSTWRGMPPHGEHVIEVHVNVSVDPPFSVVLQVDALPGGKSCDYVGHITRSIEDVSRIYSLFYDVNPQYILKIVGKGKLSDRASVNHCVVEELQVNFDIDLLELKCNVHPLDGLANESRKTLKSTDVLHGMKGHCFGKEGSVVNLIAGLSKMRHKSGSGDHKRFKDFMKTYKISTNILPRYVGNRIHVLFHLAGAYYFWRENLVKEYLTKLCSSPASFKSSLIKDPENPHIILQLRGLGLIGKIVTGPWLTVLYGNKQKLSNLEAVPILKACVQKLKDLQSSPLFILSMKEDVFGNRLREDDPVLPTLQTGLDCGEQEFFLEILQKLLDCSVTVLSRQLADYLSSKLSNPTSEMLHRTQCAPVHNIFSEEVMGMADYQHRRASNASMRFIDGKVRAAKNKTLDWLNEKPEGERLIYFSISQARDRRAIRKKREEEMRAQYLLRQTEKGQKRDQTYRANIEKCISGCVASPNHLGNLFADLATIVSGDLAEDKVETVCTHEQIY